MPPALMMKDPSPVDALQDTVMMEEIAWVSSTDMKFKMPLTKIDLFTVSDVILVGEGGGGKHGLNYSKCTGILPILNHPKSFKV